MVSFAISSGHGKHIRGARGNPVPPQVDEVDEARRIVDRVAEYLKSAGVKVATFHDNTSYDQNTNLHTITNWHNLQNRDYDVSVHLNAYDHTAYGVEVLYVTQDDLAAKVSSAIAAAGNFTNRGPKKRTDLYVLNNTDMPAVLIETFFCDNTNDCNKYHAHFDAICKAIAQSLSGVKIPDVPVPPVPIPPDPGPDPEPDDAAPRPLIGQGDYGENVREVQRSLRLTPDGDFGPATRGAVCDFQTRKELSVDGMVGSQTWAALDGDFDLPPYPPPLPQLMPSSLVDEICDIADNNPICDYQWDDRGRAPAGYIEGMAVAYAQAYTRFKTGDPIAVEMAKASTGNTAIDALAWYAGEFADVGMRVDKPGLECLRALYVLLMGLGMRESSGQYCCGRDQSASNTDSNTCEAGIFQTSWNASSCCTDFVNLFDQYTTASKQGYQSVFATDVSCSQSDWQSYGSGDGFDFQEKCKWSPTFAVETAAIGLRNLRQHWGPINRKEAELRPEAIELYREIEDLLDRNIKVATTGAIE